MCFYWKFNQFLSCGLNANLDLRGHAGNAWVSLSVDLGKPSFQTAFNQNFGSKRFSPSRIRRRERRAAFHQHTDSNSAAETAAAATVQASPSNIENEDQESDDVIPCNENNTEAVEAEVEIVQVEVQDIQLEIDQREGIIDNADKNEVQEEAVELVEDLHQGSSLQTVKASDSNETGTVGELVDNADNTHRATEPMPEVVVIHGTAVIEDSPFNTLVQEELESLVRFVTSKEHLRINIENIEYIHMSTREFRNNKFKHIVELKLSVRTSSLWESPRSYIWRHIGRDTWTRGNGASINVTKIHQKFI